MPKTFEMTDDQRHFYDLGADDARKFRADPYRDTYQDVFAAETADYKLRVSYDDPNGETLLRVNFKHYGRSCEMTYASSRDAIDRAIRFVAEHPAPRPWCGVDY